MGWCRNTTPSAGAKLLRSAHLSCFRFFVDNFDDFVGVIRRQPHFELVVVARVLEFLRVDIDHRIFPHTPVRFDVLNQRIIFTRMNDAHFTVHRCHTKRSEDCLSVVGNEIPQLFECETFVSIFFRFLTCHDFQILNEDYKRFPI